MEYIDANEAASAISRAQSSLGKSAMTALFTPDRRAEILAAADASGHARYSSQWWEVLWDVLTEPEQDAAYRVFREGSYHTFNALLREQLED